MEIKHSHPAYTNEQERLDRLQEILRRCAAKRFTSRETEKRGDK